MSSNPNIIITCTSSTEKILQKATHFASIHGLKFKNSDTENYSHNLQFTDDCIRLLSHSKETIQPNTLVVDFIKGKAGYRFTNNQTIHQPLARAVGIKGGVRPDILDVTAGLGQDSFVFASLGCKVTMIERSIFLYTLLSDGLSRAKDHSTEYEEIVSRLELNNENSISYLNNLQNNVHTIYLDPMYPHSSKSALNKIEMRIIRDLVGDDEDSEELLSIALEKANNRVVVKRPKRAESLKIKKKPSHDIKMKNSRYDVYMIPKMRSE